MYICISQSRLNCMLPGFFILLHIQSSLSSNNATCREPPHSTVKATPGLLMTQLIKLHFPAWNIFNPLMCWVGRGNILMPARIRRSSILPSRLQWPDSAPHNVNGKNSNSDPLNVKLQPENCCCHQTTAQTRVFPHQAFIRWMDHIHKSYF